MEEKQESCGTENTKKWSKTVKEVEKTGCAVNTACSSFWDETGMIRCRTARYGGKNEILVGDVVSPENTISCGVN